MILVTNLFIMKVSLSFLILVSKCYDGSSSRVSLDERHSADYSSASRKHVLRDESQAYSYEWPEWDASNDYQQKLHHQVDPDSDSTVNKDLDKKKPLIAPDYYRIDSDESRGERFLHYKPDLKPKEQKQYEAEIAAGDPTQVFGTNPHLHQPDSYPDFGRRFVLQYPYTVNKELEEAQDNSMTPKLAKPELVMAVAKESAMLAASTPNNPTDEVIRKDILRSGQYWNAFWKEDVDPKKLLRTVKRNKMRSVHAKLIPGTEIYEIVSKMRLLNPKLIYVINKNHRH